MGLKLLVAAAIAMVVAAGWIVVQLRGVERDAQPTSAAWQARRQAAMARHEEEQARFDPAREVVERGARPLPGRRRLWGRVIDGQRRPVVGADVVVTCGIAQWSNGEVVRTQSAAGGAFAVVVELNCDAMMLAQHDGRSGFVIHERTDDEEPIVLTLVPDVAVTLHVVDEETGAALAGARVVSLFERGLSHGEGARTDAAGVVKLALIAPEPAIPSDVKDSLHVVAYADGHVPDLHEVIKTAGDYRAGPIEQTIRLGRGVPITGRVVGPDDQPVAGAEISVQGPRGYNGFPYRFGKNAERADGEGKFDLRVPSAGTYSLIARTETLKAIDARQGVVEIGARGGAGVVIRLGPKPERGVRGVVVDERGAPVAGARVIATTSTVAPITADAKGEFRFAETRQEIELFARSGELASEVAQIAYQPDQVTRVTLALGPAGITGVVVDSDGAPITKAQLWVNYKRPAVWGSGLAHRYDTDEHGAFAIDVPRGAFRISVRRSSDDEYLDEDDVVLSGGTRNARIVLP